MEPLQLLIIVALLAILAEVSYLVVKLPRQTASRSSRGRMVLVDTSVLIDGRIVAVAKTGFIGGTLVIPRSVVGELQFLADNADHDKRARARFGLDVVTELQNMPEVEVEILQDGSKAEEGVDERLLHLAKKHAAVVCTIDYNLNKVAVVEGITVLNVNELAQSLRMAHLPGERMMLELVQKGQDSHQGVGYLPDGTMVVVEHASKYIGQAVGIEFIRTLQTAAGKMMFARLAAESKQSQPKQQKPQGKKPVEPKQATVFHSDKNDRQTAKKTQQSQRTNAQPRQKQPSANTAAPKQEQRQEGAARNTTATQSSAKKRQRSSQEREAALIDLVEKQ